MKLFDDFKKELDQFVEQSKTREEKSTFGKLAGQLKTEFSNEIGILIEKVDKRPKKEVEVLDDSSPGEEDESNQEDKKSSSLKRFIPIDPTIIEDIKGNVNSLVGELKENVDDFMEDAKTRKEKSLLGRIAGQISSNILYEVDEVYKGQLSEKNPFAGQKAPVVKSSSTPSSPDLNPPCVYISDEYRNKVLINFDNVWQVYQGNLIDCEHDRKYLQHLSFDRIHSADFIYCNNCYSVLYGWFCSPSDNHSYPSVNYIEGVDNSKIGLRGLPKVSGEMNDSIENLIPQSEVMS
jgi:hypothetical protein